MATPVCEELFEAKDSVRVEVSGEPVTVTWLVTLDVMVERLVVVEVVVAGAALPLPVPEEAPVPEYADGPVIAAGGAAVGTVENEEPTVEVATGEVLDSPLPEPAPVGLPSLEGSGALPEPDDEEDPVVGTAGLLGGKVMPAPPGPVGCRVEGAVVGAELTGGLAPPVGPVTGTDVCSDAGEDADSLAGTAAVSLEEYVPLEAEAEEPGVTFGPTPAGLLVERVPG